MTYPQQTPGYPPQAPPQQPPAPQQFQPAFPGGTVPQQPQQFAQPPAYGYPGQQGAYPVAPPQGYPQAYAQQPPAPQLPPMTASLDDYFNQPSAGWGPAWQLGNNVPAGTSYIGIVAQHITKAHLEFATDQNTKQVRTFKNGEPVMNMKVPLYVAPDQRFTEGRAQFYVGPGEKDALAAAMAAAGAPEGPPELGAMIRTTKTGSRGNSYGSQSSIKQVEYWRPEQAREFAPQLGIAYPDITPAPAPAHAAPEPQAPAAPASAGPAVQQQAAPQPVAPQPPAPAAAPQMPPPPAAAPQPQAPSPLAASPAYPGPAPAPVAYSAPPAPGGNTGGNMTATPAAAPPAPGAMPADPEKAALLAKLTGQAVG